MSLGKVLLYTAGVVGVAAIAKAAFTPAPKPNPFAPTGWLLVDPHVLASIDPDFDVPPETVVDLPIGATVAIVIAKTNGPLPSTVDKLKTVPMIGMEALVIGSRGQMLSRVYDLSVQRKSEPLSPAGATLVPPPQGQIFANTPMRYIAKVLAMPGVGAT